MIAVVPGESNKSPEHRKANAAFPHGARLLRHADFQSVYKQGRRHFSPSMTVFYLQRQAGTSSRALPVAPGLRIGFTVGRALGGAVQRNRMKRRLREAVRLTRPWPAPDVDVVVNPKKALLSVPFQTVLNEVRQAFVVIDKKLAKKMDSSGVKDSETRQPHAGSRF